MRKIIKTAAVSLLAMAGLLQAKPFDAKHVAADAKWVMHVDVDAIAGTNLWKLVQPKLLELPQFAKAKADVERVGQVKLPDDLHDVTIYGPSFGEHEAVVVINASFNEERLKTLVSLNETYENQVIGGQSIHSWKDNDKQIFGGIASDSHIVIGQNVDQVVKALDTLSGKSDALQKGALVPENEKAGLLVYVAGDELAKLAMNKARSPIAQQVQNLWMTVEENDRGLHILSKISAADEKKAINLKNAIEGIKAMITFAEQNDPNATLAADALLELNTRVQASDVDVDWLITNKTINDILERATGKIEKPAKITAP